MDKIIKWGIIGLGNISHKFANDLSLVQNCELEAVASRSLAKAIEFSKKHHSKKFYGSYNELFEDPFVDIIYIATPHNSHENLTILALEHKKAVLCEKPFAINKKQVLNMVHTSKMNNTFLMEAMWTRFIPSIKNIKQRIDSGEIGEINYINADFSFNADPSIQRIYDKKLGGGSLLDIGIYPVFLAYFLLGKPIEISAKAHFFESGADALLGMILKYENAQAILFSSFKSNSKRVAKISGTLGEIIIDEPWNETDSYSILKDNKSTAISLPTRGRGYTYEIIECNTCLKKNAVESSLWSHKHSIELISLLDRIREKINLRYREDDY